MARLPSTPRAFPLIPKVKSKSLHYLNRRYEAEHAQMAVIVTALRRSETWMLEITMGDGRSLSRPTRSPRYVKDDHRVGRRPGREIRTA